MWCDNCLLFFPLRAGTVVLAILMALYQLTGGFLLFKFGAFFFFHPPVVMAYAGFAMIQGAVALLAAIAISNRSYLFSKLVLYIYPFILFLGAIRAGVLTWELRNWEYRIVGECQHDGHQWLADYTNPDGTIVSSTYAYNTTETIPIQTCNYGIHNFVVLFVAFIVIDFILMLYFNFLIWRFTVKLEHYPLQKGMVIQAS